MNDYQILQGDCLASLKLLPSDSVDCCVTSPPYFGLRDYGTAKWEGGDPSCNHVGTSVKGNNRNFINKEGRLANNKCISSGNCKLCGAIRTDDQIGLEETPDAFVARLVDVFREVRRVLKPEGTCWVNMGDSYAAQRGGTSMPAETIAGGENGKGDKDAHRGHDGKAGHAHRNASKIGLKHKDLIGIPWLLAFALRADGWYLRQDIIWHKPNPMPESVTDRCTKSHEYIFLLTKSPKYYFDNDAIKTPVKQDWGTRDRKNGKYHNEGTGLQPHTGLEKTYTKANKRSVWSVNTKAYREAHFATYPPALIEPCILAGCPEGGVVLDPFGGSGTTAEVAIKNRRKAILCELNPDYIGIIKKRLSCIEPTLAI